jgi:hypothetical protein
LEGQRVSYVPPVRLYVFLLLSSATMAEHHGRERPVQLFTRQAASLPESANDTARQQEQQLLPATTQATTPARRGSLRPILTDSVLHSKGAMPGFWNWLGVKRAVRWHHVTSEDAVHQILRGLSLLFFLIMLLAALLLKSAYFQQHRHYISHLVSTVHIHCFLFVDFGMARFLSKLSLMA